MIKLKKTQETVKSELDIQIPATMKSDREIKTSVWSTIKWNSSIDEDRVHVEVNNGWVTLTGNVEWDFQRSKAGLLAGDIQGVAGVTNLITVVASAA